jgi:hypothetical protein
MNTTATDLIAAATGADTVNTNETTAVALFRPFAATTRKAPTFRDYVESDASYAVAYTVENGRLKWADKATSKLAHARYDAMVKDHQAKDKALAAALVSVTGNHVAAIRGNKAGDTINIQLKLDKTKRGAKSPEVIALEETIARLRAELAGQIPVV